MHPTCQTSAVIILLLNLQMHFILVRVANRNECQEYFLGVKEAGA
jgi:hypothetical protein